jgi:glycosyltransferase involved in cell wall biosynthesis
MKKNAEKKLNFEGKSLHVLYTGLVYADVITGGDQLFLDIAPRLPKDLKIIVITPHFVKKHWDNINQSNIEFRLLPPNIFEFKGNPFAIFLSYVIRSWQVYRILKKENVQTIYSSSDIAYADIWPAYWATKGNSQIKWLSRIYHVLLPPSSRQGSYLVNIVAFRLQRLSFWMMKKRSSTIFALNSKLHKEVLDLGFPKDKLKILGAGIDFQKINSFKPTQKYPYDVVVLGRLTPVKGIFDTIKMWEKVHAANPSLQLAWIGGGAEQYRKKMSEQLEENSLSTTFHLLGFIDKDEVYSILQSAKVFLCPDHENGWGLAVCEAMASGLPVVSYDLDIFGGVYKKGFKSVPLFDTDSFADELIKLLNDEAKRKKMAKDAVDQASQFDHERVIDDLVKYL